MQLRAKKLQLNCCSSAKFSRYQVLSVEMLYTFMLVFAEFFSPLVSTCLTQLKGMQSSRPKPKP
jgi:hypothetical protein